MNFDIILRFASHTIHKYILLTDLFALKLLRLAVTYALNQKKELLVFLEHPEVEMTNNLAERTVKPFVIDRKNFLFSDTEKGAEASAAMPIIETAKRNGLDVYGYLLYLLTALPALGKEPSEESLIPLLPWSDSLPDYCKAVYDEIRG
ncbi:MAG: transposase [Oscillospiraceae bacterium]